MRNIKQEGRLFPRCLQASQWLIVEYANWKRQWWKKHLHFCKKKRRSVYSMLNNSSLRLGLTLWRSWRGESVNVPPSTVVLGDGRFLCCAVKSAAFWLLSFASSRNHLFYPAVRQTWDLKKGRGMVGTQICPVFAAVHFFTQTRHAYWVRRISKEF